MRLKEVSKPSLVKTAEDQVSPIDQELELKPSELKYINKTSQEFPNHLKLYSFNKKTNSIQNSEYESLPNNYNESV
jgi:hypothetical protein